MFIEDIGETPYRIDRMLLMLKQAGKLRACAGILLGAFTDCAAPDPAESLTLREVITELLLDEEQADPGGASVRAYHAYDVPAAGGKRES